MDYYFKQQMLAIKRNDNTPVCPYCEENETTIDSVNGILLCNECAIRLGEIADRADLINRSDW